jgi:hypothetical protein
MKAFIKRHGWYRIMGVFALGAVFYVVAEWLHQIPVHIKAGDVLIITGIVLVFTAIFEYIDIKHRKQKKVNDSEVK